MLEFGSAQTLTGIASSTLSHRYDGDDHGTVPSSCLNAELLSFVCLKPAPAVVCWVRESKESSSDFGATKSNKCDRAAAAVWEEVAPKSSWSSRLMLN